MILINRWSLYTGSKLVINSIHKEMKIGR